jgi:hypothetical protein
MAPQLADSGILPAVPPGGVLYDLGESLSDTQRPSTVAGAAPTARAPADLLQQAGGHL